MRVATDKYAQFHKLIRLSTKQLHDASTYLWAKPAGYIDVTMGYVRNAIAEVSGATRTDAPDQAKSWARTAATQIRGSLMELQAAQGLSDEKRLETETAVGAYLAAAKFSLRQAYDAAPGGENGPVIVDVAVPINSSEDTAPH